MSPCAATVRDPADPASSWPRSATALVATFATDTEPRARPRPAGRLLGGPPAPTGDVDGERLDEAIDIIRTARRRPRRGRARDHPPGRHRRRPAARACGTATGRSSWWARPPSCGSGRSCSRRRSRRPSSRRRAGTTDTTGGDTTATTGEDTSTTTTTDDDRRRAARATTPRPRPATRARRHGAGRERRRPAPAAGAADDGARRHHHRRHDRDDRTGRRAHRRPDGHHRCRPTRRSSRRRRSPSPRRREEDEADATVVLDGRGDDRTRYELGPTACHRPIVEKASARLHERAVGGQPDDPRRGRRHRPRSTASPRSATTPSPPARPASSRIVLDGGRPVGAARSSQPSYSRRPVLDQRRASSEAEAKDLALVLRYGSLPVEFERQAVQTVSAIARQRLAAGRPHRRRRRHRCSSPSTCSATTGPSASWSSPASPCGASLHVRHRLLAGRDPRPRAHAGGGHRHRSCRSARPSTPTSSSSSA